MVSTCTPLGPTRQDPEATKHLPTFFQCAVCASHAWGLASWDVAVVEAWVLPRPYPTVSTGNRLPCVMPIPLLLKGALTLALPSDLKAVFLKLEISL